MLIKVIYNGRNIYACQGVFLAPGENWVDNSILKKALKNEFFRFRVDTRLIVVDGVEGLLKQIDPSFEANDRKSVQAKVEQVNKIHDLQTLKERKKKEKSSKVKEAIEKREEYLEERQKVEEIKRSPLFYSKPTMPGPENNFQAQAGII